MPAGFIAAIVIDDAAALLSSNELSAGIICNLVCINILQEGAMRILLAIVLCCVAFDVSASSRYIHVPGFAFKTDPSCHRTKPADRFDPVCDEPVLGYKDFSPFFLVPSAS